MLEAADVGHRFSRREPWLFRNVSLRIAPGEIVGVVGPSGQGKTTLARILAGYLAPGEGRALLDGQPLPAEGYCPVQYVHQRPELAVNPRWPMRRTLTEAYAPPADLLAALGVAQAWLDRYPYELSGGELQRIALARVMGPKTRFLIADEITSMLDALTQAQIWGAVLEFCARRGVGALVISHDRALLGRLCKKIVVMENMTR